MATIQTIQGTDVIANSRADINTNFANLNSDKIETSVLDTDTTLAANSDSKIATQKAVKAYVDAGGNVNASTTTKGIVEEATVAEVVAGTAIGGTGARLFVNPSTLSNIFKFGGTGADGALAITSGATNIDLGSAQVVTKNYTSISITGTGSLTFTNPHANGTTIILKSQGAVTLTSSTVPMIVASGLGGAEGTDGYSPSILKTNGGGASSAFNVPGVGGALPVINPANIVKSIISGKYPFIVPGAGGNGGGNAGGGGGGSSILAGSSGNNSNNSTHTGAGSGGRGGGSLIIECAGAFNFTTSSGISVAGVAGGSGSGSNGSGGGGGGGGVFIAFYNTLTANSGSTTISGGAGGASGGAGPGTGGAGGDGYSLVAANTEFV